MTKKCLYCGYDKPSDEFSLEHILPRDIGGAACPDLFKTHNVCQRCNSLSGLFIDGAFLKSWFTTNNKSINAQKYVDYHNGSILPLIYIGVFDAPDIGNRICEMWLGPTGDLIYHLHLPVEERFSSYAGGDPIDLKKNPGDAYLFATTDDPGWIKTVLLSFKEHFKYARRFAANIGIGNQDVFNEFFTPNGPEQLTVLRRLKQYRGETHKCKMSISLGYEQRFLFKLAIGLGYNLLGEPFIASEYYQKLKAGLWEKDYKKRCQLGLRGSGILQSDKTPEKLLGWEGGNTIFLKEEGEFLLCILTLGDNNLSVCISDRPALWRDRQLPFSPAGLVHVVIPQRNLFIGPIDLEEYIAHKSGVIRIWQLTDVERMRVNLNELPPFRSEEYEKTMKREEEHMSKQAG